MTVRDIRWFTDLRAARLLELKGWNVYEFGLGREWLAINECGRQVTGASPVELLRKLSGQPSEARAREAA
jgi:hypothetical protein